MVSAKEILKIVLFRPLAILLTILICISLPLLLIIQIIPCNFYKYFVILLSKCVIPGSTMLPFRSSVFANGDVYQSSHMYISGEAICEGRVCVEKLRDLVTNKVIQKEKSANNGKLMYPELQQFVYTWMGYSFFRKDRDFDIRNHVTLYQGNKIDSDSNSVINRRELCKIRMDLCQKLFKENQSPWELFVINNYRNNGDPETERSAIILKIHHALADGFASVELIQEFLAGEQPVTQTNDEKAVNNKNSNRIPKNVEAVPRSFLNHPLLRTFRAIFNFIFKFIYDQDRLYDQNVWHNRVINSRKWCLCVLDPIEKSLVKDIAKQAKVTITTVLTTVITGGVRRMMIAKDLNVPYKFRMNMPLPLGNRPRKLGNFLISTSLQIPIGIGDSKLRMQMIEKNLSESLRGPIPLLMKYLPPVLSAIPLSFEGGDKSDYIFDTMELASLPIRLNATSDEWGHDISEINGCVLLTRSNIGVFSAVYGYRGHFFATVEIESSLLNNEDEVHDIEKYILEELQSLSNSTLV